MSNQPGPKKIVVLGGVGALTAVYHLTNQPDWQEHYDITVYRLGWRLGGRGASGRGRFGRIEEHGPHLWYSFYENAFQMIRDCYDEMGRMPGQRFGCRYAAEWGTRYGIYLLDGRVTPEDATGRTGSNGYFDSERDNSIGGRQHRRECRHLCLHRRGTGGRS